MSTKIVAGSITYNENMYAPYVIKALYGIVDYWVVVDHFSNDGTVETIKKMDTQNKFVIIQRVWDNSYCNSRNSYLQFIRDHIYNPGSSEALRYLRVDFDEFFGGKLNLLKEF